MIRKLSIPTVAALFLLIPAKLMAGGPPRLFMPLDGVTAANADECAKRLECREPSGPARNAKYRNGRFIACFT